MEVWLSFSSESRGRSVAREQKQGLCLREGYGQGVCNIAVNWTFTVEMPYLKQRQVFSRGLVLQRISLLKLLLLVVVVVGLDPSC